MNFERDKNEIRKKGIDNPPNAPVSLLERGEISLDNFESGDSRGAYNVIGRRYIESISSDETNRLEQNLEKLRMLQHTPETDPSASGYIAVAYDENPEGIKKTLELLQNQTFHNTEVLLYANYPDTLSSEEVGAFERRITTIAHDFNREGQDSMRLLPIFAGYKPEELTISRLRKDCMNLIAADGLRRGFEFDHPVFVLDADILTMSRGTIKELVSVVKDDNSSEPMAVSTVNFNTTSLERGSVQRLTLLAELMRRSEKNLTHYFEECGTVFSLGAFAFVGGYYTEDPASENTYLLRRFKNNHQIYKELMSKVKPKAAAPQPEVQRVPSSCITISSRRIEQYFLNLLEHVASDPQAVQRSTASPLRLIEGTPFEKLVRFGGFYDTNGVSPGETMGAADTLRKSHIKSELAGVAFERIAMEHFFGSTTLTFFEAPLPTDREVPRSGKIKKAIFDRYTK